MLLSWSLAARFKQVVLRLRSAVSSRVRITIFYFCQTSGIWLQIKDELVWISLREDYDRLNKLCKIVDDNISHLVLLSFANNLFFILVQLFYSLK